jgi:hypothetical protein
VKSLKFILCLLLLVSCGQKPDGKSHLFGAKSGDKYLLIDSTGEIRLSTNYSFISSRFNNSLAYFRDKNGKYGYINLFGEEVIKPSYDDASLFNSGVATVAIEDKYGVINNLGEPVLSPGRRKPSLGLPDGTDHLTPRRNLLIQQVIMGQVLSLVGLCRRNTTSRVEEYGGLREVSFLSVKKQRKSAKFN